MVGLNGLMLLHLRTLIVDILIGRISEILSPIEYHDTHVCLRLIFKHSNFNGEG